MKRFIPFVIAATLTSFSRADTPDSLTAPSHYLTAFFGKSVIILGSEDGRFGGGISYAYGRPEHQFQFGNVPAQLVYEGYIDHTQSDGGSGFSANATFAAGGLGYARWRWLVNSQGDGLYLDLGWGLQLASQATLDLNSVLNSTPVLDFGTNFKTGRNEYLVGFRYLHISNAGFVRPNFGQNEVFLTVGIRY